MQWIGAILLLLGTVSVGFSSPLEAVALAHADALTLPPYARPYTRYLDLTHHIDAKERDAWVRVLSGHVNGLSIGARVVPPVALAGGRLLRLNLQDYRWDEIKFKDFANVYAGLVLQEPYFHDKVKIVVEDVPYERQTYKGNEWVREVNGPWVLASEWTKGKTWQRKTRKVTTLAPWLLTPREAEGLQTRTMREDETMIGQLTLLLQTSVPVLRGDWFFQQTAIAEKRTPNYYDFLGVKNLKDFERLIGFDAKLARDFRAELKEAVSRSNVIVGRQARRIETYGTIGGAFWLTKDSEVAAKRSDPLDVLDDALEFDAQEGLAPGPNGMMKWVLADKNGVLQTRAPDGIASDGSGAVNDSRVHVNLMCIRCHANSGIKDFREWGRNLFKPPNILKAVDKHGVIDYEKQRELQDWYLRRLEPYVEKARAPYAAAILEATGWKPEKYATEYYAAWERYIADDVDLKRMCREMGCSEAQFLTALKAQAQFLPPVFLNWLRPREEWETISVTTWEAIFPDAMAIRHGLRVTVLQSLEK